MVVVVRLEMMVVMVMVMRMMVTVMVVRCKGSMLLTDGCSR